MEASPDRNAVALTHKELVCLQVGNLPVTVIPVYMAVVGCPISTLRNTCYSVAPFQKEPITRCPTTALVFDPRWPHTHTPEPSGPPVPAPGSPGGLGLPELPIKRL